MACKVLVLLMCVVPMALAWGDMSGYGRRTRVGMGDGNGYGRLARALVGEEGGYGKLLRALMRMEAGDRAEMNDDGEKDGEQASWHEHPIPSFLTWFKFRRFFDGSHGPMHWDDHQDLHDLHDLHEYDMRGYWRRNWGPWSRPAPFFWWQMQQRREALRKMYADHAEDVHEMVHRYDDLHEKYVQFEQFKRYMAKWEEHTKKAASMKKMELMAKMHAQAHKEQEFGQIMKSFAEKKKQYVFTVLFELMKFCKCKESMMRLNQFFKPDGMQSLDNMNNTDIMDIDGHLALLHPQTKEEAKKMFMKGLLQTLCVSAKGYVQRVRMIAAHHMALHFGLAGMDTSMDGISDIVGGDGNNGNGGDGGNNNDMSEGNGQVDPQANDNLLDRQANNGNFRNNNNNNYGNNRNGVDRNRNFFSSSQTVNGYP